MNERSSRKTGTHLIPVMLILLCLLVIPGARPVMARTKSYMKNLKGISWDLKTNGKWVTYQTKYAGIGMHDQKVKITKWKNQITPTDAKILTFRITVNTQWKMTKSQVHKMTNSSYGRKNGDVGALCGYYIVDYETGENLEAFANEAGVEVTDTGWHIQKTKTYRDQHGCSVSLNTVYTDVEVVYYPGTVLAIGFGGSTALEPTGGDKKFEKGKVLFEKTSSCSKKNKKIAHFKKVK